MMNILIVGSNNITDEDFEIYYIPLIEQGIKTNSIFYVEDVSTYMSNMSNFTHKIQKYFNKVNYKNIILCSIYDSYPYSMDLNFPNHKTFLSIEDLNKFMVENTNKDIIFLKDVDEENSYIIKKILTRYIIP